MKCRECGQEALDYDLGDIVCPNCNKKWVNQVAVEQKANPTTVIPDGSKDDGHILYRCVECANGYPVEQNHVYCPYCGRLINWQPNKERQDDKCASCRWEDPAVCDRCGKERNYCLYEKRDAPREK